MYQPEDQYGHSAPHKLLALSHANINLGGGKPQSSDRSRQNTNLASRKTGHLRPLLQEQHSTTNPRALARVVCSALVHRSTPFVTPEEPVGSGSALHSPPPRAPYRNPLRTSRPCFPGPPPRGAGGAAAAQASRPRLRRRRRGPAARWSPRRAPQPPVRATAVATRARARAGEEGAGAGRAHRSSRDDRPRRSAQLLYPPRRHRDHSPRSSRPPTRTPRQGPRKPPTPTARAKGRRGASPIGGGRATVVESPWSPFAIRSLRRGIRLLWQWAGSSAIFGNVVEINGNG